MSIFKDYSRGTAFLLFFFIGFIGFIYFMGVGGAQNGHLARFRHQGLGCLYLQIVLFRAKPEFCLGEKKMALIFSFEIEKIIFIRNVYFYMFCSYQLDLLKHYSNESLHCVQKVLSIFIYVNCIYKWKRLLGHTIPQRPKLCILVMISVIL